MTYSAPPTTKIAATTVVSKKARTLLRGPRPLGFRGRLLPAARLRCCDKAVLPSAERSRQGAGRAGPLRPRQRVSWLSGYLPRHDDYGQNHRNKEPDSVAAPRCQK